MIREKSTKIKSNVMVIVAHPDDETIGVAGTLARYSRAGIKVSVMCMTDGVGARGESALQAINRRQNSELAALKIGFEWIFQGEFPDNMMDTVPFLDVVKLIEKYKNLKEPNIVFTHSPSDLNIDHRIIAKAVLTAFRPIPNQVIADLYSIEIPSATDFGHNDFFGSFKPNYFVDISSTWDLKLAALQIYGSEIPAPPHSRSVSGIDALSKLRGHQSGIERAEAFQLLRKIEQS
jgi:LmbE family N-acetylglucosaminyl deacetylase